MADEEPAASSEDLEKPARDAAQLARKWTQEIAQAEKAQAKWVKRAEKVEKIYNDERDLSSERKRQFNILWSNVETLRPAVYMQTPKAQAVRRYRDRDPVARLASMLLQRSIQVSCELYDFDSAIDQAVRDRLVPGRGQVWTFYVPAFAGEGDEAVLEYESVVTEYVPWKDFLHSTCRTWAENRWVARCFHKTRIELKAWLKELGFNPAKANQVRMDVATDGDKSEDGLKDERSKAKIWEVWDKTSGKVLYVAPGSDMNAILGVKDPPVRFRDFFPCPRPLLATTTSKSLIPTPDYALYQDQAEELNRVTERIGVLQKALKVAGVYSSDSTELANLIEASDNVMIPVQNWAMFAEGGGAKGRIEWFPVEQVAVVLRELYAIREQAKQALYEVSGIGDILRGATDPDETLGAQKIKEQWGGLRVRRVQKEVQRFAADVMRLKAEVIAEQFQDRSILAMAGVDQELLAKYVPAPPMPPANPNMPPQMAQQMAQVAQIQAQGAFLKQVFDLLRNDPARNFRIDVETDSTLEPNQAEEKQMAVEFITVMTGFMEKAAPLATSPEAAKLIGELLLFGVRHFGGKVDQLEQTIEQAVEAASKPQPAVPDPEIALKEKQLEADVQDKQARRIIELKRLEEVEKPKVQIETMKTKVDAVIRGREVQMNGQQAERNEAIERDRMDMEREDKGEARKLERRKLLGEEGFAEDEASRAGKPTTADALMALVEEMKRPVKVTRGADGRVAGFE